MKKNTVICGGAASQSTRQVSLGLTMARGFASDPSVGTSACPLADAGLNCIGALDSRVNQKKRGYLIVGVLLHLQHETHVYWRLCCFAELSAGLAGVDYGPRLRI